MNDRDGRSTADVLESEFDPDQELLEDPIEDISSENVTGVGKGDDQLRASSGSHMRQAVCAHAATDGLRYSLSAFLPNVNSW